MGIKPQYLFIYCYDDELESYLSLNFPFEKRHILSTTKQDNVTRFEYEHYRLIAIKQRRVTKDSFLNSKGMKVAKITVSKSVYDKVLEIDQDIIRERLVPIASILSCLGHYEIDVFDTSLDINFMYE